MTTVTVGSGRNRKAQWVNCKNCEKHFKAAWSEIKRGGGKYCSIRCARNDRPLKGRVGHCKNCGLPLGYFQPSEFKRKKQRVYCDLKCRRKYQLKFHSNRFPTSKTNAHYSARLVYRLSGKKLQCAVIWCRQTKNIHIHHKNHDRTDNNPKNLIALCLKHHMLYHRLVKFWRR